MKKVDPSGDKLCAGMRVNAKGALEKAKRAWLDGTDGTDGRETYPIPLACT